MTNQAPAVQRTEESIDAWSSVQVAGVEYLRHPVRTRWLEEADELVPSLREHVGVARPGDTVAVSEKAVVLLTGRAVAIDTVQPGTLARTLSRCVRPRTDSRGLSVPEKMEYVVRTLGYGRVIAAALGGAMTRPLGIPGAFYLLARSVARDIDGGCPPYEGLLFPPLDPAVAQEICADLERALGVGVSIVDLDDFGGSIRAVSPAFHPSRNRRLAVPRHCQPSAGWPSPLPRATFTRDVNATNHATPAQRAII
jgi:hypothetical protein